jgi:hypothetical protein
MFLKKFFYKIVAKFWQCFAKKNNNKSFDAVSYVGNHLLQNCSNKIKIKINGINISQNSLSSSKPGFVSSYQKNKKHSLTKQ